MANTVNIGKSAKATAGRGQLGGSSNGSSLRRLIGLAAVVAVVLGLAVGTTVSRTRKAAVPAAAPSTLSNPYWEYVEDATIDAPQSVLSNPFAYDQHVYTEWDFREDRRAPAAVRSFEEQRFLELNTQLPDGTLQAGTQLPEEASTSEIYRWDFGGGSVPVASVGPVPAFDWEQQERGQVAPGPVSAFDWEQQERGQVAPGTAPVASAPIPGSGPCRPGSIDCLPDEAFTPGVKPSAPTAYTGPCRAGSSDCLPDGDYPYAETPGGSTGSSPAVGPAGSHGIGPADEYGQTSSVGGTFSSCVSASSMGAPGEGCDF